MGFLIQSSFESPFSILWNLQPLKLTEASAGVHECELPTYKNAVVKLAIKSAILTHTVALHTNSCKNEILHVDIECCFLSSY
jgi:hypothetical protein